MQNPNAYVNHGVDLHDETESGYKSSNPQNEDQIFNFGTREIYKITDMSTQSLHTENNEVVVYKSVDDKYNHIIMTERKFSVKSQDKLKVEIDNSAFRRLNYRTADNPPMHLTLFVAMQVMCVYFWQGDVEIKAYLKWIQMFQDETGMGTSISS